MELQVGDAVLFVLVYFSSFKTFFGHESAILWPVATKVQLIMTSIHQIGVVLSLISNWKVQFLKHGVGSTRSANKGESLIARLRVYFCSPYVHAYASIHYMACSH